MSLAEAEQGGACRKHPNHAQSEGVCSSCVTERLAKLSSLTTASRSSASRNTSDVKGSIPFELKKSRSLAYVSASGPKEEVQVKKKLGFWSKLLRSSGKRSKEAEF